MSNKTKVSCQFCGASARFIQGDKFDRSELIYLCNSCNNAFASGLDHDILGHDMKEFILEDFDIKLWLE